MAAQDEAEQSSASACQKPYVGSGETSLWEALHDSRLRRVESCTKSSTTLLEFEIPHLTKFHHMAEETRFLISFHAVDSLFAETPPDWNEIESRLNGGSEEAWIYEATLLTEPDGKVALKLFGSIDDDSYPSMTIRAAGFSIRTSQGVKLSLGRFLKYGEDYWEAFAARGRARRAAEAGNETAGRHSSGTTLGSGGKVW